MQGYFLNQELKRSSIICVLLMACFLLLTLLFLQQYHQRLKLDYIETLGTIAARVEAKHPEIVPEIMPLITKEASREERTKGTAFIREYGLTEELEDALFPNLDIIFRRNNATLWVIFIGGGLVLFVLNYFQYAFFYQRVRRITEGAKKIIEGEYDIAISEDQEGDFSKLANSFNTMGKMIRSQMDDLKKEKQFLVHLMSDISHQLKTPLSSLVVYNDIMLNKELAAEQRETFLIKMQDQLERMKWLIYSILKLAKLDARSIDFEMDQQSLNETIHNAMDALESKATASRVRIVFQPSEEILFVHDRLWLEEALINIIKNGIEHTPPDGQITVKVEETPLYTRVSITDTGEGIREEEVGNIFKRFYKVSTPRKTDSLGIGLAIAKSIVVSHHGVIEVRSQVGVGTTFLLTFLK